MTIATATARLYDSSFVIGPFRRRAAIRELAEAADPSGLVRLGEALGKGHPNAGRIAGVLRQLSPESDAVKVRALWHAWAGAPTPAVAAVLARLGWPPGPVAEAKTVREVLAAARAGTAPDILKAVALFARALPVGDQALDDQIYGAWIRSQSADLEQLITEQGRQPGNPALECMHALVTGRLDRYAALKDEDGGLLTQAFALAPEAFRERMAKAVAGSPEETYRFARTTGAVDTGKSVENLRAVGDEDYEDWLFETTRSLRLSAAFELCERLAHGAGRNRITVNVWDGSLLAYVPAGMSEMGDGQDADCPKHRVELSTYWIGIYAVTNAQYLKFVRATGHRAPDKADYGEAVWKNGRFSAEKADHPVVCVSWDDAVAYARWAGCRLPTEAEWEKAARGRAGLLYPWGNDWDEAKCRHAKNWWGSETTCAVYGYSSGVSGYGTYNQSGNVWEWCSDWYGGDYYQASPAGNPRGPETGSLRVSRGGCWGNDDSGRFRAANRRRVVPDLRSGYLGFRLARAAS